MNRTRTAAALLAVLTAAACAPAGSGSSGGSEASSSGAPKSEKKSSGGHLPVKDVTVTKCEVDDTTDWPSAALTITNHSSKASNYIVSLEFVDKNGTRLDEGTASTSNLAPGQTSKQTAQGLTAVKGSIRCKVTDVTRYASG